MGILDTKEVIKLKAKEVVELKKEYLSKQGYRCPLCRGSHVGIPLSKLALDHCHDTGFCRGLLCMGCNRVDGIVKKAILQWGKTRDLKGQVEYVKNLANYLETSLKNPSRVTYHLHKTPEKEMELKKKRALAAAKKRRRLKK